ncbi:Lrp/AsnC family transcriptional regulator [Archaeoglobus sp.]
MKLDVELLMALQYNLPLTTTPLVDLAEQLGRNPEEVIRQIRDYVEKGVVKRYGLNLNYRAFSNYKRAALVGFRTDDVEGVARKVNAYDEFRVKHNFLREAYYNVWFTVKGRDLDEINAIVGKIAGECGVDEYVVLPTKRVYKMDVKYDLIKGVSWSNRGLEPESVPLVRELGLEEDFVRSLESLDIVERPFAKFNCSEEEVVDIIQELMKKGVGRDFSGVLRERKVGFKENGMTVLKLSDRPEKVAMQLLKNFPQITHLIERIANEKWNYPIYFMVHAVKRETIDEIRQRVLQVKGVEEAETIYSRANLRET